VYSEKTPDGGQRNCPKHVDFCSKNEFEKLVHLVGFIIRIYHDAWSPELPINDSALIKSANITLTEHFGKWNSRKAKNQADIMK